MTAIDRAAEIIYTTRHETGTINSGGAAQALADAGLLVTDEYAAERERFRQHSISARMVTPEAQAVLDRAVQHRNQVTNCDPEMNYRVDAYLASQEGR